MSISIRNAKREEAKQLSSIAVAAKKYWQYPDHWFELWGKIFEVTPEFIEKNHVWVAYNDEVILGFIALSISEEIAELEHMWIMPEHMKKGGGKKLLEHALKFCRESGVTALRIESEPKAKGFYERLGARHVGEVKSKPSPRVLPVLVIEISKANHALHTDSLNARR